MKHKSEARAVVS